MDRDFGFFLNTSQTSNIATTYVFEIEEKPVITHSSGSINVVNEKYKNDYSAKAKVNHLFLHFLPRDHYLWFYEIITVCLQKFTTKQFVWERFYLRKLVHANATLITYQNCPENKEIFL